MADFIADGIKVRNLKGDPIKTKAVTKYTKSKDEYMKVIGVKIGKAHWLIFQDKQGMAEFWTKKNIVELYTSGQDTMAALVGMDFMTRNNILSNKERKSIEDQRQKNSQQAVEQVKMGLNHAVDMLIENNDKDAAVVLETLREKIDKVLNSEE